MKRKTKRIFSLLLALAVMATMLTALPLTVRASTVSDLKAVSESATYYFVDYTASGTTKISKGSLFAAEYLLAGSGDLSAANNKRSSTINESSYLNCLRIKDNVNIVFKVASACTVTIYGQSHASRVVRAGTSDRTDDVYNGSSAANTGVFTFDVEGDNVNKPIYINSYDTTQPDKTGGGDLYLAGITFEIKPVVQTPSVKFNSSSANIALDGSLDLSTLLTTSNLGSAEITYSIVSGSEFVSLEGSTVTANAQGTATVKASATVDDVEYSDTIEIVSGYAPVTALEITPESATIYYTKSVQLSTEATPSNATDTTVIWKSSDDSIATVDSSGKVTAKSKKGSATITATSVDGPSAQATITVTNNPYVTSSGARSESELVAPTKTVVMDLVAAAEAVGYKKGCAFDQLPPYLNGYGFFDNAIMPVGTDGGNAYYGSKTSVNLDETTNDGGILIKLEQEVIAVKIGAGSTIKVPIKSGGGGDRYGTISSASGSDGDLYKSTSLANYGEDVMTYTNNTGADQIVYLSATGDSFIAQIQVIVPPTFGATDTDKGFYYDADVSTKLGVIRFFQEVAASGVENYGFYILDSKGETEKAVITPEAEKVTELVGIYADLYGIPETDESKATNYYMKAFVTIGGETYVAPSAVYTTPDFEREVEYTVTETEEVTE